MPTVLAALHSIRHWNRSHVPLEPKQEQDNNVLQPKVHMKEKAKYKLRDWSLMTFVFFISDNGMQLALLVLHEVCPFSFNLCKTCTQNSYTPRLRFKVFSFYCTKTWIKRFIKLMFDSVGKVVIIKNATVAKKNMASILGFHENDLQSVLLDESNFSRFETPMPKNAKNSLNEAPFSVAPMDVLSDENNNQFNNSNNNSNEKKANAYDYLDYGSYINRILSQQEVTGRLVEINWNFQKTEDKVNVVNVILQLLDNKTMFLSLLTQTRESIERLKRNANESEMKLKSYECNKKKLETDLHLTQMRYAPEQSLLIKKNPEKTKTSK
ncbi:hypothetical protein RFI_10387 [Reticulomyxa filosa]|uniref:Uncharacterized protein n=1 Tax=Reticulomyxa filosa TaxID=46433 RepID=X6NLF8_RETFI|nr:hypothetical protein RFI_10387 [Reticulomyxa filosa]|eukprot:ETO26748.1 hypothetical protein RFI_10387 [Reticulomyxa filosa]